jgi:regulator of replication initiation timing
MDKEQEQSYLSSLLTKLYDNTAAMSGFNFTPDMSDLLIKKEVESDEDDGTSRPESKKRKVSEEEEEFFKNSSASIISESTEKTLKQMNIDPNSKEGKIQRRKIRNRMSAQIHRERKRAYIDYLEDKVRKRDEVISLLQTMLKKSNSENERLQSDIEQLRSRLALSASGDSKPVPIMSPADSSTSNEESSQCHQTDGSQGTLSPDIEQDYFSDFEVDGDDDFDPLIFRNDSSSWIPEQYQDFGIDLDLDNSLSVDDILKQQAPSSGGGRSTVSLFSIVLLMGFSFFGGFLSMGSMSGMNISTGSILQPWSIHPSSIAVSKNFDVSYPLLSEPILSGDVIEESRKVSQDLPVSAGGRVLLSLSSVSEHDTEEEPSQVGQYFSSHSPQQLSSPDRVSSTSDKNYVINRRNASFSSSYGSSRGNLAVLWRQQNYHSIGTFFPREMISDKESNRSSAMMKNKKYLRFRNKNAIGDMPNEDDAIDKSLTLYYESSSDSDNGGDPSRRNSPPPATSNSKILLSEGRVLLSPLLANLHTAGAESGHSENRVADYETDRAIIPSVPGDARQPSFRHGTSKHSSNDTNNLLTMLIPASSIQWGFEWADDTSPDNSDTVMRHLLENFNISSSDAYNTDSDSKGLDMSKLWLEIGCNVLQAKIVQSIL